MTEMVAAEPPGRVVVEVFGILLGDLGLHYLVLFAVSSNLGLINVGGWPFGPWYYMDIYLIPRTL